MTLKEIIESASTLQKLLEGSGTIAAAVFPPFLNLSTATTGFGMIGGVLGVAVGGLLGLYYMRRGQVGGWLRPSSLAIGSLLFCVVVLNIANGALPSRYPWLTPVYDLIFVAPLIGSVLFGIGYASFWGAVASFLRFLPGRNR